MTAIVLHITMRQEQSLLLVCDARSKRWRKNTLYCEKPFLVDHVVTYTQICGNILTCGYLWIDNTRIFLADFNIFGGKRLDLLQSQCISVVIFSQF